MNNLAAGLLGDLGEERYLPVLALAFDYACHGRTFPIFRSDMLYLQEEENKGQV